MAANDTSIKQHLETFIKHVEELRQTDEKDVDGFEKEFHKIRQESMLCKTENRYPATEALREVNLKKNRFKDIAPYDYTRVKLQKKAGVAGSDYINANFIKGVNGKPTYIASQGPLPHTTSDFWRMLWQYDIKVVIMVCRELEMERPRCHRYWPNTDETLQFDDISVTLLDEQHPDPDDQFVFRELHAVRGETTRTIHHLHFLAWPDRFVPSEYAHVIDLLAKARDFQTSDVPPIVIHCSAGCGRTGSLVVVDYVWNLLKTKKITADFSLFDTIKAMRTQRPSIVQSEEQYYFVHKAVEFLFKEHLSLLTDQVYENVEVTGTEGLIQNASLSGPSLRIIQNTVQELVAPLKKEPMPAPRKLSSDPSEKPVISDKPNITKKRDISTRSNVKPSATTDDTAMKSPDPSKASARPEKLIKPYEEVIVQPSVQGAKLTLLGSNPDRDRLVSRPPVAVPDTQSPSGDDVIYSEVLTSDMTEEQQDNEYCYADPKGRGKWSLQHIALDGVTEPPDDVANESPFEPGVDYSTDESYESDNPEVPPKSPGKLESGLQKVTRMLEQSSTAFGGHRVPAGSHRSSDKEAKNRDRKRHHRTGRHHKRSRSPHSNTGLPQPGPVSPLSSPTIHQPILTWVFEKKVVYQGIDISFPNRVGKPKGPREMAIAARH